MAKQHGKKEKKYQKKPHTIIQKEGRLTFEMGLSTCEDYPATCTAMDMVAKSCSSDDVRRIKGFDNYTMSLQALLNAFDTFIREFTKEKHSAGYKKLYDLSVPSELTILLLWQVRNIMTHHGGMIDKKCKNNYEKIYASAQSKGIELAIPLPSTIIEGYEFTITLDDYKIVTKCIFDYIKERVSKEDYKTLSARQSFTDLRISVKTVYMYYDFGTLAIDKEDAIKKGCKIDLVAGTFQFPSHPKYNFQEEKIVLEDGLKITAKIIKNS